MKTIADRLATAQQRIVLAAQKCARPTNDIQLLAVSKTKPSSQIIEAYHAGQRAFGENYVQEGQQKILELKPNFPDIEWHFIGPLQSNKSRIVAEHFDWIHTVSRGKIAKRLSEQRPLHMSPLNVCIQINISHEDSKSGTDPEHMLALAREINALPGLTLRGLMAIPTDTDDVAQQNREFAALKACFDELRQAFPAVDTLSLGMSGDLEQAIAHGSTMVRIGSAIFGARD
ncbi:MAG: YggS family pyridoxal phosphate-dependent enzyme [Shewanella sp.]|nr:YggS family pyridoxal phosphate-dependent enzyme [Shewanella sp.]MCF1430015.1 YggS family pyridoxal phosphate-dependent enzyme [Shewanella sp.]MCF1437839.1 YggS family pyridoxal phosphate-dependent enzyme [Shewanella sp.]MCF1456409.1 YggS family pyridoxal phosphate-dependent enzyme [Shewanella sp.]